MDLNYKEFFVGGDLNIIKDSTEQAVNLALITEPGEWKNFPKIGVGAQNFVNSNMSSVEIESRIKTGLKQLDDRGNYKIEINSPDDINIDRI